MNSEVFNSPLACGCGNCFYKGQLILECLFDVLNFAKKQQKIWQISALESKKCSNQQNKGTFL